MEKLEQQVSSLTFSRLFNISVEAFEGLHNFGLTLDQLFYLECLNTGLNGDYFDRVRGAALRSSLERKSYITNLGIVTTLGAKLLENMHKGKIPIAKVQPKPFTTSEIVHNFDKWWSTYPGTDVFIYKNKSFTGSRSLRVKKDDCKAKFGKILTEGEYTAEDLIKALEYEVTLKKEASLKEGVNKLSYLTNSLTYLNQRGFENFVELARTLKPIINQSSSIDI